MNEVMTIKLLNEGISLFLLMGLSFALYRGVNKNQILFTEREELLKRYLFFRGDKQVRLKIYEEDEKIYRELLKNLSNSWKIFKKAYDQSLLSLSQNTIKTKRLLQLLTLGILINSLRLLIDEYYFFGLEARFFHVLAREFPNYVLVILSFVLLSIQTHKLLSLKGEASKMERELLSFPHNSQTEQEFLYNEFDPLDVTGVGDGEEDQDSR